MYREKHLWELISTLLNIKGKSKDGLLSKWLRENEYKERITCEGKKSTFCSVSKSEKQLFCKRLYDLKWLDGYGSKIQKCVSVDEYARF